MRLEENESLYLESSLLLMNRGKDSLAVEDNAKNAKNFANLMIREILGAV